MNKATRIGKNTIDMRNIIKKVIIGRDNWSISRNY